MNDEISHPDEAVDTAIPNTVEVGQRGLLDIRVLLSTPTPTAGSEFKVYVLVTNPFDVPIHTSPPSTSAHSA